MLGKATLKYGGPGLKDLAIHYWGVDLDQFKRSTPLTSEPVIGFFKHLLPKYGPEFALRAFSLIKSRIGNARLLMVGQGDMKGFLVKLAIELGIESSVEWLGKVEHSEIAGLMERCAVTIMPSTEESETLGVAALESQAVRVPVVASNIGGIPESVMDQKTGFLVPPENETQLAKAITVLLVDAKLREEFGIAGRKFVEENFDWNITMDSAIRLYDRLKLS